MVMRELERRLEALESMVRQILRPGTVTSVLEDQARVRVKLPDCDGMESKALPVLFPKTHKNKSYDLPDVGEQVLCLFLPTGLEQGFVLGASYSEADPVPVQDRNKTHYAWPDGTKMEYDRADHTLTINISGPVKISGEHLEFSGPAVFTDSVSVARDITAGGTVMDAGGNSNHHAH